MAESSLQCPRCAKKYRVRDYKPGAKYKCKACGIALAETEGELRLKGEPEKRIWEIPVRLGRYVIDGEVARGGMGVIYKGRQEGLDRVVAIKMMLPGPAGDPEMSQRFSREARAAAALRHPNIVAVHEIGEYNGQPFFTMDFVEGKPLDKVFLEGPMKPERGAEILRDVARAIHYAHENGIVHRDLKPQNIMIEKDGTARVTDFGLAKDMGSKSMLSITGEVLGTPAYMSPEQAEGRIHEIDAQSDVYSLGAILYRILTGRVPFEGNTIAATIYKVVHEYTTEPLKLNKRLPADLSAICMKALEKEKPDRYATAADFADDLDRYMKGEPVVARPLSQGKLLQRRLKQHKTAVKIVSGVTAVAIFAIIAVIVFSHQSELNIIDAQLRDPALRPTAAAALFEKLPQWSGKDRSRAENLALEVIADRDPKIHELVLAAFEKKTLKDWKAGHEALAAWLPEPRVIAYFTAIKEPSVVPQMKKLLSSDSEEVKLGAVRYFRAVPDSSAFYSLGLLITHPRIGPEAREAINGLYICNLIAAINPAASNMGGVISQMGSEIQKGNEEREKLLNESGGGTSPKDDVEMALRALQRPDRSTRMQAAFELGQKSDPRVKEPLFAAIADNDEGVARMAAYGCTRWAKEFKDKLIQMLEDSRPGVRGNAAFLLGKTGDASAYAPVEKRFKVESDEKVKSSLLDAMQALRK